MVRFNRYQQQTREPLPHTHILCVFSSEVQPKDSNEMGFFFFLRLSQFQRSEMAKNVLPLKRCEEREKNTTSTD